MNFDKKDHIKDVVVENGEWVLMLFFVSWGIYVLSMSLTLRFKGLLFPVTVTLLFLVLLLVRARQKMWDEELDETMRDEQNEGNPPVDQEEDHVDEVTTASDAISLEGEAIDFRSLVSVTLVFISLFPLIWLFGFYFGSFAFTFMYLYWFSEFDVKQSVAVSLLVVMTFYYLFNTVFFIGLDDTGGYIIELTRIIEG